MQRYALISNQMLLALATLDMPDHTGWTLIDTELPLDAPMIDGDGRQIHKVVDGLVTERTEDERSIPVDYDVDTPTISQRVETLEQETQTLADAVNILLGGDA